MWIKTIKVSNFKSFDEETIELDKLTILIGSNAAGKSNTISIFSFLTNIIDYGLENAISLSGGIEYVLNTTIAKERPLSLAISCRCDDEQWIRVEGKKEEIKLLLLGFDYEFEITPHKKGSGYRITKDKISLKYCPINDSEEGNSFSYDENKTYTQIYRRNNGKIVSEYQDLTDMSCLDEIQRGANVEFIKKFLEDKSHRKELIFHFLSIFLPPVFYLKDLVRVYDFDPKLMKKSSSLTSVSNLEGDGANLANILQSLLKSKNDRKKLESILSDCLPFVESISTESNFDKSVSYKIKEKYSNKPLYANFLSDGTVSILAIILALSFEKNVITIILEEPERNLHPFLMNRLLEMAEETSKSRQIIITTHTPELVKHAKIENILFASRCEQGFSRIQRPSSNKMVQTFLENEVGLDTLFIQNLLGE